MAKIFTNRQSGGVWSVDGAVIVAEGMENLVINSMNMNFGRSQQKISPLNRNIKYTITGDSSGTMNIGHIIGPDEGVANFLEAFAGECPEGQKLEIHPQSIKTCEGNLTTAQGKPPKFILDGLVLASIGFSVQSAGGGLSLINGSLQFTFDNLEVK